MHKILVTVLLTVVSLKGMHSSEETEALVEKITQGVVQGLQIKNNTLSASLFNSTSLKIGTCVGIGSIAAYYLYRKISWARPADLQRVKKKLEICHAKWLKNMQTNINEKIEVEYEGVKILIDKATKHLQVIKTLDAQEHALIQEKLGKARDSLELLKVIGNDHQVHAEELAKIIALNKELLPQMQFLLASNQQENEKSQKNQEEQCGSLKQGVQEITAILNNVKQQDERMQGQLQTLDQRVAELLAGYDKHHASLQDLCALSQSTDQIINNSIAQIPLMQQKINQLLHLATSGQLQQITN